MYVGNAVHAAIGLYYKGVREAGFRESVLVDQPVQTSLAPGQKTGLGDNLRPDIYNLTTREVYEIKPESPSGLIDAYLKLTLYELAYTLAGIQVLRGRSEAAGTSGFLSGPGGFVFFRSPVPGVITYTFIPWNKQVSKERKRVPLQRPQSDPLKVFMWDRLTQPQHVPTPSEGSRGFWAAAAAASAAALLLLWRGTKITSPVGWAWQALKFAL
jgi:hypothetical protein